MAILSEVEEDHKAPSSSSVAPSTKPFSASFDPSNPLGFLENVFEFVGKESDLFKSDSLVKDVNAVLRMVKDKLEAEEKKRKEVKLESNDKVEKEIRAAKEAPKPVVREDKVEKKIRAAEAPKPVVKEEVKEEVLEDKASESKEEDEKKGPRGILLTSRWDFFLFFLFLRFIAFTWT